MKEIWKDIVGYEGIYWVSNKGRLKRKLKNSYKITEFFDSDRVCLVNKDKESKSFRIKNLIFSTFSNKPLAGKRVITKNGNDNDNRLSNLKLVDRKINMAASIRGGMLSKKLQSKKLYQYSKDNKLIKRWDSMGDAQRKLKIDRGQLSRAANGKSKTCKGFIWKYV